MNIEICRKCMKEEMKKYNHGIDYNGHIWKCDTLNRDNIPCLGLYYSFINPDEKCTIKDLHCVGRKIKKSSRTKNFTEKNIDNIEMIDKSCLYYLEHLMYDLNKKT